MCSWIFDKQSLVDFLAFCFALNTMFSFARVRQRLLWRLKKGLKEILEENAPAIMDIEAILRKASEDVKVQAIECFQIKDHIPEITELNRKYERRFNFISKMFQYVFYSFAFISAVLLVFSNCPLFLTHYKLSILLLVPSILFIFFSWYFTISISFVLNHKRKEINKDAKKVNVLQSLLKTVKSLDLGKQ